MSRIRASNASSVAVGSTAKMKYACGTAAQTDAAARGVLEEMGEPPHQPRTKNHTSRVRKVQSLQQISRPRTWRKSIEINSPMNDLNRHLRPAESPDHWNEVV